jgi:HEAT repeat protein
MFRTTYTVHRDKSPGVGYFLTLILASLLAVLVSAAIAKGAPQNIERLNRLVQETGSTDAAAKAFREGRELINASKWVKAAERFSQFVNEYPRDKNIDAALYWMAYARYKQGKPQESLEVVERLMSEHPQSSWKKEAESLKIQLASQLNDPTTINQALNPQNDKEKQDAEIRIIALQSLFQSNPASATQIAANWLKADSTRSQEEKEAAINLLGHYGGEEGARILADLARNLKDPDLRVTAIQWVLRRSPQSISNLSQLYDAERDEDVKRVIISMIARQNNPEATAKLMQIAKSDSSPEMRQIAISLLSRRDDAQTLEAIIQLYNAERDEDVKRQILGLLYRRAESGKSGQPGSETALRKLMDIARTDPDEETRRSAIHYVSRRAGPEALGFLIQLYDSDKSEDIKESILHMLSRRSEPEAKAKLQAIAKSDPNPDRRRSAIHAMYRTANVSTLTDLYDSQQDEDIRVTIINLVGRAATAEKPAEPESQKVALRKLMQIAKNDSSMDLRREALRWLGRSKDPEATKFIEDILK